VRAASSTWGYGIQMAGGPHWFDAPSSLTRSLLEWRVGPIAVRNWQEERSGPDWTLSHGLDAFVLDIADGSAFRFDALSDPLITVALRDWSEEQASVFFLMAVLPLTLSAFGLQPFHGAAIEWNGNAILLLGDSGVGKSTTLEALLAEGATFLADDACAIDSDGLLWPGPPMYASWEQRDADLPPYQGKGVCRPSRWGKEPIPVGLSVILQPRAAETKSLSETSLALKGVIPFLRSAWLFQTLSRSVQIEAVAHLGSRPVVSVSRDRRESPTNVAQRVLEAADLVTGDAARARALINAGAGPKARR
jgi:hypothetical protein